MKKLIKIFAFLAAGFLILLVAAGVWLRLKFPPEKLKAKAGEFISSKIGLSVNIGRVSLSPLGIRIGDIVISQAKGFGEKPLLIVKSLSAQPRLIPLLRGEIWINKISLEAPEANIFRNAKGIWNFSSEVHRGPFPFDENLPKPFSLRARNLKAVIQNLSKDRPFLFEISSDITTQGHSFSIQGESIINPPQETIHIKALELKLPQGELNLSGSLKELRKADGPQMDLRIQGERIALEALSQLLPLPKRLVLFGAPILDIRLRGNKSKVTVEGTLDLKKSMLGYGDYFLKARDSAARGRIQMDFYPQEKRCAFAIALEMGPVSLQSRGEILQRTGMLYFNSHLILPEISIASLREFSPRMKKVNVDGKLKAEAKITGPSQSPQLAATLTLFKGSLTTDKTFLSGAEGRLSLSGKRISGNGKISHAVYRGYSASEIFGGMIYEKERLSLNSFSCKFYDGTISGRINLSMDDTAHASYETEVTVKGVDIAKLPTALKMQGRGKISGNFSGKLKLSGKAGDWNSLSGSGEAILKPLKLEEMSFGKGLAEAFGIQELKSISFENAASQFTLASGILNLQKFETQGGDRLDLTGTGQTSLAARTYDNLSGEIKLAKAYSGGALAKYTGDAAGRVTAPYTLGGTFENPKFKIHWDKMATQAIKRAAEEVIQKHGDQIGREAEKIFRGIFGK